MEASRPIDSDINMVYKLKSGTMCLGDNLEYRYPYSLRYFYALRLLKISDSKLEMLEISKHASLCHDESNLRFTRLRTCNQNKILTQGINKNLKRGSNSYAATNLRTIEVGTPEKTKLMPPKVNLNIDLILKFLKSQFDHVNHLSIKEPAIEHVPGTFAINESPINSSDLNLNTISDSSLFDLCCKDKSISLGLQCHLSQCSEEEAMQAACRLLPMTASLITDQLGNYVIQRLICRLPHFEQSVADYCINNFSALIHNAYASRVMQCLTESRPRFNRKLLVYFSKYLKKGITSTPAIHVVISCIKKSKGQEGLLLLPKWLKDHPRVFWHKGFQKVLSAYILICSRADLDEIFNLTMVKIKLYEYLDSKTIVYFFTNMLLRSHEPTEKLLLTYLAKHPGLTFQSKCWRLLIANLWEDTTSEATKRVATALANIDSRQITNLMRDAPTFASYLYTTIRSLHVAGMPDIDMFMARYDLSRSILDAAIDSSCTCGRKLF